MGGSGDGDDCRGAGIEAPDEPITTTSSSSSSASVSIEGEISDAAAAAAAFSSSRCLLASRLPIIPLAAA